VKFAYHEFNTTTFPVECLLHIPGYELKPIDGSSKVLEFNSRVDQ